MYKHASNNVLLNKLVLGKQKMDESYSLGKALKKTHIEALVNEAVTSNALPKDDNDVYFVLTSDDIEPLYGPQTAPLVAPNGDVGIDDMVINIATILVGVVTNPFNIGYYHGDAATPLEAMSSCPSIYGKGAYPGYPSQLLVDATTGASFNAYGVNGRMFLLPAMWDPVSLSCKTCI
eukprot:Gb_07536 [translate_table: standard]